MRLPSFACAIALGASVASVVSLSAEDIVINGGDTLLTMTKKLTAVYHKTHPNANFTITITDSGLGYKALTAGQASIAMTARPPKGVEAPDAVITPVAVDAMLILVNGRNPVRGLDKATVKKIYQGEITTWNALGWTGQIRPVSRAQRLASTPFFEKAFGLTGMEQRAGGKLSISYGLGSVVPCSVSNHDALATVIGDPGCILFLSRGTTGVIRALQDGRVRALAINGVDPDIDGIASGRYPLLRRMTYAISRTASPTVKDFVTWASGSEAARTQILTCDLVPFTISVQPTTAPAAR